MPQSLVKNYLHLVYSTKHREPTIRLELYSKLYAYQGGIFAEWKSPAILIGGTSDHVHALFSLSKNHSLAKIVEEVKKGSSKWMKTQGVEGFYWQGGYAAFSVSESKLSAVKRYIATQDQHHSRMTFQEELRMLFAKHRVAFDERYVWD